MDNKTEERQRHLERTMGRSTTWLMRTARLADGDGEILSVLLRLMMVVNDVGLAKPVISRSNCARARMRLV
jgi:hypothetical protein